jgi:hypothetical protein
MSLRFQVFSGLAGVTLLATACNAPAALLPLAARSAVPEEQTVALPTEDGSHYILVEARPRTSNPGLARKWHRTAEDACRGDYMVLSTGTSTRRTSGVAAMRIQEGWVRCVSPEAIDAPKIERGTVPETKPEPKKAPTAVPKAFAL